MKQDCLQEIARFDAVTRHGDHFRIRHLQRVHTFLRDGQLCSRLENVFLTLGGAPVVRKNETTFYIQRGGVYLLAEKAAGVGIRNLPSYLVRGTNPFLACRLPDRTPLASGQVWRRKRGGVVKIIAVNEWVTISLRTGVEFEVHRYFLSSLLRDAKLIRTEQGDGLSGPRSDQTLVQHLLAKGLLVTDVDCRKTLQTLFRDKYSGIISPGELLLNLSLLKAFCDQVCSHFRCEIPESTIIRYIRNDPAGLL